SQFLKCGNAGAAFWGDKESLLRGKFFASVHHLGIGHCYSRSAAFPNSLKDEKVAERFRHSQPAGYCRCPIPEFAEFLVSLKCLDNRPATLGLNGNHFGTLGPDPT